MPVILYIARSVASPPVRAVEAIIRIIKLDVTKREIDVLGGGNMEPWFLELSPTRQVPVLDDDGYILTDSHAIIAYLLTVYAPKDILEEYYPTDPKLRGIIDSKWHFENGTLFARLKAILFPIFVWGKKESDLEKTRFLIEGVHFLEIFLEGKEWIAGDRLTVADISTLTTMDGVGLLVPLKYYKNITAWAERVRKSTVFCDEDVTEQFSFLEKAVKETYNYDAEDRWNKIKNDLEN